MADAQLPDCNQEVFNNGVSVGLFDIPKETAEAICLGISAATGARVDWHYIAGRVHIKALPATPSPPGAAVPAAPVAPTEWGISPFLSRATPVPTRPWFERIWKEVNLNDMPYSGSSLLRFAHAVFDAASRTAQPQPQPAQPLKEADDGMPRM